MNCHFDSIFFWWMNCHFCSIGSSFFYGCIVILAPAIFRDELSFWTHLLYGWITIFAPWIFILAPSILWINCQFWLHLFYQQSSIWLYHKIEKTKYWLYWRLKREFRFHFMRKINLEDKVGVGSWLSKFWCTHTYIDIKPSGGYHKLWERSKVETRIDPLENFITCGFTWKGERDYGKI